MEACAVTCASHKVRSSICTVLGERQVDQSCLIAMQIFSYKGGEEKGQEEITDDQRGSGDKAADDY